MRPELPPPVKLTLAERQARREATRRRRRRRRAGVAAVVLLLAAGVIAAVAAGSGPAPAPRSARTTSPAVISRVPRLKPAPAGRLGPVNVYAADTPGDFPPVDRHDPALVYVPNSESNTVSVISQRTMRVISTFPVGALPQHVTPAYDLRTLYVDDDLGNELSPIDPRTGHPRGAPIPVEDPYNLYFTPDGRFAIVVAERLERLDFRDPHSFRLVHTLSIPECHGLDHADFSADGRFMYASCEFAGKVVKIDLRRQAVVGTVTLNRGEASPQDVKLSPDGRVIYVADQVAGGVWELDPRRFRVIGFLPTGAGAHGLYPSRDAKQMYVSNRQAGSVSVVSFASRRVVKVWRLPQPASPDMGGVSANGRVLWLSGRYNGVVYAINTRNGHLIASIPVGAGPHGLCVWPQPGRYSLGHTGILR